jgi:hypothetical protein
MLSIQECKIYLAEYNLPDEEIERIRNSLYLIIGKHLDSYLETNDQNKSNRI